MAVTAKGIAGALAAWPLVVAAQSNPIPHDTTTTGRQNTVTGTDATDTSKNIARSSKHRAKIVTKPAGNGPKEASAQPNVRSRQDYPKSTP